MMAIKISFVILALNAIFTFNLVSSLAVMSVDLGNEWMKVAIVSPGKPMEIILNTDSARKTPVAVAFRDGERYFGDAALSTSVRFPEKTYTYILDLVGKQVSSPLVQLYMKRFPYHKITADPDKGTVILHHPEGETFNPEELLAMLLEKAKQYAETANGGVQLIADTTITVPPYFTQAERRSVIKSAELAGLKVLQLINGNTAVGLNYGVFRRKDFNETNPANILFYDMGASSTVATVASFQIIKTKERGFTESNPHMFIKGVGFDRTLGGFEMQMRLRDHLIKLFAEQKKLKLKDVESNKRAMAKLLKEAGRLKKVLSANTDFKAQIENVMNDIDFSAPVSRSEFEELCSDILDQRLRIPIETALKSSGLALNDIDQVILFGGGTRIPKVQQVLSEVLGGKELGKSVNSDEAAALGAAYQAAYLSKGFKVKTFIIKDSNVYPIQVDFSRDVEQEDGQTKTKIMQRLLFQRNNPYPQKKVLTFSKHNSDFDFYVNYGDLSFLSTDEQSYVGSHNISKITVKEVADILSKHTEQTEEFKGIKAHFRLDDSGILNLDQVEAWFETKVEEEVPEESNVLGETFAKFGNTISKLFGRGEGESGDNATDSQKHENVSSNGTAEPLTPGSNTSNETQTNSTGTGVKKEIKIKTLKEKIPVEIIMLDVPELDNVVASRTKLNKLNELEIAKFDREKAKNNLESFIHETKMKLYETEYETASTEEEREKILKELQEAAEWLEYESDSSDTKLLKDKFSDLKSSSRGLFDRVREHRERPEILRSLKELLNISTLFLQGAKNASEIDQIFTSVEVDTLEKLIADTKKWLEEASLEQERTALSNTPKLTVRAIAEKISSLDREVKYLINKARITPPKKSTETPKPVEEKAENEEEAQASDGNTSENLDAEDSSTNAEKLAEKVIVEDEDSPSPDPTDSIDSSHTEL